MHHTCVCVSVSACLCLWGRCIYYTHTYNVCLCVCVYAGQKLKGKVRNVEDFGAFVDVGAGTKLKIKNYDDKNRYGKTLALSETSVLVQKIK